VSNGRASQSFIGSVFEKINEVIDENCQEGCSSDSEENVSEVGFEEFKNDFSASTI